MPLGRALALVETFLPDPGAVSIVPEMLAVSAAGLARQIELCAALDGRALAAHPLRARASALYPEPHSPVFDFDATAAGAEWIDAFAARARIVRDCDHTAPVIAHSDWAAQRSLQ